MATIDFGGPYYQSAIRAKEKQEKALGGQGLSPAQLAAITHGELTSRYSMAEERRRTGLMEREMELREGREEKEEKAATIGGIASLGSTAATMGLVGKAIFGAAPTTAAATALASEGAVSIAPAGAALALETAAASEAAKDVFSGIATGISALALL
jgi:hypothetical protein